MNTDTEMDTYTENEIQMNLTTDMNVEYYIQNDQFLNGCVKWFSPKNGYGFITFKDYSGKICDIFVHHNFIKVLNNQYKYLIIGEYVRFKVGKNTDTSSKHKFYAIEVSGIDGGKLMCETRKEFQELRLQYMKSRKTSTEPEKTGSSRSEEEGGWKTAKNNNFSVGVGSDRKKSKRPSSTKH